MLIGRLLVGYSIMITSLRLVNFKNFADETLRLGPFTVIVGANASGKSNIRDAFRFLHGIGRGYTLAEIMGGKYGEGGQREWTGIRGAMNEIVRSSERRIVERGASSFMLHLRADLWRESEDHYSITPRFNRERFQFELFRVLGTKRSWLKKRIRHNLQDCGSAVTHQRLRVMRPPTRF